MDHVDDAVETRDRQGTAETELRRAATRFRDAVDVTERRYGVLVAVLQASDPLIPDGRAARILAETIPAGTKLMRRRLGRSVMAVRRIRGKADRRPASA